MSENEKAAIRSYRDLKVWLRGMELAATCYELTQGFPKEEVYGITSQIRRAASSIPANIAEGYGRDGRSEFIQFLRIAQGSLKELETHLLLSIQLRFVNHEAVQSLLAQCDAEGRQMHALIRSLQAKAK